MKYLLKELLCILKNFPLLFRNWNSKLTDILSTRKCYLQINNLQKNATASLLEKFPIDGLAICLSFYTRSMQKSCKYMTFWDDICAHMFRTFLYFCSILHFNLFRLKIFDIWIFLKILKIFENRAELNDILLISLQKNLIKVRKKLWVHFLKNETQL